MMSLRPVQLYLLAKTQATDREAHGDDPPAETTGDVRPPRFDGVRRRIVVGKVIVGLIAMVIVGYLLLNLAGLLWLG